MASSGTTVEFHPHDERNVGSGSWKRGSPVQIVDKSSAEISSGPSDVSRNAKPSCLRRPSPKIGFFDAVSYCLFWSSTENKILTFRFQLVVSKICLFL